MPTRNLDRVVSVQNADGDLTDVWCLIEDCRDRAPQFVANYQARVEQRDMTGDLTLTLRQSTAVAFTDIFWFNDQAFSVVGTKLDGVRSGYMEVTVSRKIVLPVLQDDPTPGPGVLDETIRWP